MGKECTGSVELSDIIGQNGKYQLATFVFSMMQNSVLGYLRSSFQFLAPDVIIYWSVNGSRIDGMTFESSKCLFQEVLNSKPNTTDGSLSLVYKSDFSSSTLTEKFEMICERSWLINFGKTLLLAGTLVAYILFCFLSERLGRKFFFFYSLFPVMFAHFCILFATNYMLVAVGCVLQGFSILSNSAAYISMIEVAPTSRRPTYAYISAICRTLGDAVAAGLSLIFKDWYCTQIAYTVYVFLTYSLAWYSLESPSWLVVRGREEDAKHVLKRIAHRNGMSSPNTESHILQWVEQIKKGSTLETSKSEGKIQDLFKRPLITKYMVSLIWMETGLTVSHFALSNNMAYFGSNIYEDAFIGTAISIVFCIACLFTIKKVSLRQCSAFLMFIFSLSCCLYPLIKDYSLIRTVFSAIGRGIGNLLACICNAYILEVLPTSVRGVGGGFIRIFARIASLISPFTQQLALQTEQFLPVLVFGLMIFPNAFIYMFLLPETKNKVLVHTVEELEKRDQKPGTKTSSVWFIRTKKKEYQVNAVNEDHQQKTFAC